MLTEEEIGYLAKMDGISIEEEKKKCEQLRKEVYTSLIKDGQWEVAASLTDEYIDEILSSVLKGYRERKKDVT